MSTSWPFNIVGEPENIVCETRVVWSQFHTHQSLLALIFFVLKNLVFLPQRKAKHIPKMNTFAAALIFGFVAVAAAHVPVGKYESTGQMENTEAFSVASGTPHINGTIYNEFTQNGDEYVHKFSVPSANYNQELPFKLGEQRTGNYHGKDFTYKYYMDDGHLKAHFDGNNKHIKHSYKTEGDGYIKEYKTGNVMSKVWFKKSQ